MEQIAVIGVGRMGSAAVRALAAAGHRVRCFDVSAEAMTALADFASPSGSVAEAAADADLVLLSLRGPDDVAEVTATLRDSMRDGSIVADLSTVDPETSRAAAATLAAAGVAYLDAPVLGRPERAGVWTIPCGGDADAVRRAAGVLEGTIAQRVVHVGASGSASVLKLMNNLMLGAINGITAEALAVCSAAGLDPGVFVDVVADSGAASVSPMFRDIAPRIVDGDFTPTFTVGLMHKDNRLAVEVAERAGVPLVVGRAVDELNRRALDDHRDEDSCAVVKLFEAATGMPARRQA
ncbi:NAD(P)-dependent oxidoreductase [Desertimonas flava]|uniref:NAD(P)-dependent oxidoreductase n=1 Tax=Desertimonas flava TaxID=2064846 RepID=UPI0013C49C18|nr:NAD(P)-dependent oxidoreductase [Desertimonas flava]